MTIQLHLTHTLVECEAQFLNSAWQLHVPYDVDFSVKERCSSNFAFWPS